jgi:hypothetical protein
MLRRRKIKAPLLRSDPRWKAERIPDKGRYVWFEGTKRERKSLTAALKYQSLPYPKRERKVAKP